MRYIIRSGADLRRPIASLLFNRAYSSAAAELSWPSHKVRAHFLDYFCRQHKHKFLPSSSVLPSKHSGTYFTNSGMNQFKAIILGEAKAGDIVDLSRYQGVANAQKCIRIGGKHSDLADIGKDTYHHTFFEMLGNWSFGSYGKQASCRMALDLLVNGYKLHKSGLYFTYFGGDQALGLPADLETKAIWLALGVAESHLLPFGMRENFWEMDSVGRSNPPPLTHHILNLPNTWSVLSRTLRPVHRDPLRPPGQGRVHERRGGQGARAGQRRHGAGDRAVERGVHGVQPSGR